MPRFPKKEAEIRALVMNMAFGLGNNGAIYPDPPVDVFTLIYKTHHYTNTQNDTIAAAAAAEQATSDKDAALEALIEAMKTDLRYAENTVDFDDARLNLIGWAGKKAPTPLAVPGQSRLLEVSRQGADWVMLDWKAPAAGGKAKAYKLQRRDGGGAGAEPAGDRWKDIATAILTEITLVDQPRGVKLEYRVIAVNKAGDGQESNTVEVVL